MKNWAYFCLLHDMLTIAPEGGAYYRIGASPCATICRPYGTRLLQRFYPTPIILTTNITYLPNMACR